MEALTNAYLQWCLSDLVMGRVNSITVGMARRYFDEQKRIRAANPVDLDFMLVLAGAPDDVDYTKLSLLAKEELIRHLTGENENGNDNA